MEGWVKIPAAVCKPGEELQEMFDLCHCQPGLHYKELRWTITHKKIFINHFNFDILSLIVEVYLWLKLQLVESVATTDYFFAQL